MAKEKLSKTKLIRLKDGTRDGGRDRLDIWTGEKEGRRRGRRAKREKNKNDR